MLPRDKLDQLNRQSGCREYNCTQSRNPEQDPKFKARSGIRHSQVRQIVMKIMTLICRINLE